MPRYTAAEVTLEERSLGNTRHTATLVRKCILSEAAQCFHLEFCVEEKSVFTFAPGQFISCVATDPQAKTQVRAYSIASAPRANCFDLCANRVAGGFFSNLLCDMEPGATLAFNGPLGTFTLEDPLQDSLLIATGTGIAPMRAFVQALFPAAPSQPLTDRRLHLIYGTRHETELYYEDFFAETARHHPNFEYTITLSRPHDSWIGRRGYVQEEAARWLDARSAAMNQLHTGEASPAMHAYLCGFRAMITATRTRLVGLGWEKKQIAYERYD